MDEQEFTKQMDFISGDANIENGHKEADDLLCEVLEDLGYKDGVRIFREMGKYYA